MLDQLLTTIIATWPAQIIGFLALFISLTGYLFKEPKINLYFWGGSEIIWSVHLLLLGSLTGALILFASGIRLLLTAKIGAKRALPIIFLYILTIWVITFLGAENKTDLLPAIASTFFSIALFYTHKVHVFRFFDGLCIVTWLLFAVIITSVPSFLSDLVSLSILIISSYKMGLFSHSKNRAFRKSS